jgi:hypothetical protein
MSTEPLSITALDHWVLFGATWRVVEISAEQATVDMCTCTGEPVERRQTHDPAVIAYLREQNRTRDAT